MGCLERSRMGWGLSSLMGGGLVSYREGFGGGVMGALIFYGGCSASQAPSPIF